MSIRDKSKRGGGRTILLSVLGIGVLSAAIFLWSNGDAPAFLPASTKADSARVAGGAVIVDTVVVRSQTVRDSLGYVGTLEPRADIPVISQTQGQVVALKVRDGESVVQGMPLCVVDTRVMVAGLRAAEAALQKARKDAARMEALYKEGNATEYDKEQSALAVVKSELDVEIQRKALDEATVNAPISGVIASLPIERGSVISPGERIASIVDISLLKLVINVSEKNILRCSVGALVRVAVDALPGSVITGRITKIAPRALASGAFPVTVEIANGNKVLRAGMSARASITGHEMTGVLSIPRGALVAGPGRSVGVYVARGGRAVFRSVEIEGEHRGDVVIASGSELAAGDVLIVRGQNRLIEGRAISIQSGGVQR